MAHALLRPEAMELYVCGRPIQALLCLLTGGILLSMLTWLYLLPYILSHGLLMADTLPQPAMVAKYKYGMPLLVRHSSYTRVTQACLQISMRCPGLLMESLLLRPVAVLVRIKRCISGTLPPVKNSSSM